MYIMLMVLLICPGIHCPNQRQVCTQNGWDFAQLQGLQTLVILSKIWMYVKEKQD